jgi:hypothetical protein
MIVKFSDYLMEYILDYKYFHDPEYYYSPSNFKKFKKIEIEILILTILNDVCFFKAGFLETVSSLEFESMTLFFILIGDSDDEEEDETYSILFFLVFIEFLVDLSSCLDDITISISFLIFKVSALFLEVDAALLFSDLN